jgi:uncharacterized membrane protein YoaK (UPF0700 family)
MVVLTVVTGLLDAVTYLGLGHVFAANQTGTIIVLGFALGGADEISTVSSVASLGSFLARAAFGWAARASSPVLFAFEACLLGLSAATTAVPLLAPTVR